MRLYAYGIAVLAVLALLWGFGHMRYKAGERAAELRMQGRVDEANRQTAAKEKAAEDRLNQHEKDYESDIRDLNTRLADALARAPRVQKCPRSSELPKAPANAGSGNGGEDRRGHASEDGNLAPAFILYAADAEGLRQTLKLCKTYGAEIERFRTP